MSGLKELQKQVVAFRDARDWQQFHKPKDCAISLVLEAAEVAELFQWEPDDMQDFLERKKESLGEELSDVLYWIFLMAHDFEIDLEKAFERKMGINGEKYPEDKVKGRKDKYTQYE